MAMLASIRRVREDKRTVVLGQRVSGAALNVLNSITGKLMLLRISFVPRQIMLNLIFYGRHLLQFLV